MQKDITDCKTSNCDQQNLNGDSLSSPRVVLVWNFRGEDLAKTEKLFLTLVESAMNLINSKASDLR